MRRALVQALPGGQRRAKLAQGALAATHRPMSPRLRRSAGALRRRQGLTPMRADARRTHGCDSGHHTGVAHRVSRASFAVKPHASLRPIRVFSVHLPASAYDLACLAARGTLPPRSAAALRRVGASYACLADRETPPRQDLVVLARHAKEQIPAGTTSRATADTRLNAGHRCLVWRRQVRCRRRGPLRGFGCRSFHLPGAVARLVSGSQAAISGTPPGRMSESMSMARRDRPPSPQAQQPRGLGGMTMPALSAALGVRGTWPAPEPG
jgi:hypothetical protein